MNCLHESWCTETIPVIRRSRAFVWPDTTTGTLLDINYHVGLCVPSVPDNPRIPNRSRKVSTLNSIVNAVLDRSNPQHIIYPLGEVCPRDLLTCRVFVADHVYECLAKVVSEDNCKARSGVLVGIDYDNGILCGGRECDSVACELVRKCAATGETMVRGMSLVEFEMVVFFVEGWSRASQIDSSKLRTRVSKAASSRDFVRTKLEDFQVNGHQVSIVVSAGQYRSEYRLRVAMGYDGQANLNAHIGEKEYGKLLAKSTASGSKT